MTDDAGSDPLLTWADVNARLKPLGRGAPYQLAQALGMNHSFLYRKLKSRTDLTERQARGVRDFLSSTPAGEIPGPAAAPVRDAAMVPVFGYAAPGGQDRIALDDGAVVEWMHLPMGLALGPGDWLIVRAIGSTMEPRIFAGEPLLVRRRHPPTRGKDVLVEFTDGTGVIKTYQGERQGRVFVEQWNDPRTLDYDASTVRALHGGVIKL